MFKTWISGILALLSLCCTACVHQWPQDETPARPDAAQRIRFDWSADTTAAPGGMRLWLYPCDWAGEAFAVDIPGRDGGEISVPEGHYHIITYNNDTEWINFGNTADFLTHNASTRDASVLEPLYGSRADSDPDSLGRVAACPEPLWTSQAQDVYIGPGSETVLSPVPLHCHYTFRFTGLDSLEHVAAASAAITGMSAGVNMAAQAHRGDVCTHPLAATVDASKGEIRGEFYTFGVPESSRANRMSLYLIMDNGDKLKFTKGDTLDVTAQIKSAADPRNVALEVHGLHIPQPMGNAEAGFDAHVDDWTDIINDIPI